MTYNSDIPIQVISTSTFRVVLLLDNLLEFFVSSNVFLSLLVLIQRGHPPSRTKIKPLSFSTRTRYDPGTNQITHTLGKKALPVLSRDICNLKYPISYRVLTSPSRFDNPAHTDSRAGLRVFSTFCAVGFLSSSLSSFRRQILIPEFRLLSCHSNTIVCRQHQYLD